MIFVKIVEDISKFHENSDELKSCLCTLKRQCAYFLLWLKRQEPSNESSVQELLKKLIHQMPDSTSLGGK